MAPMLRELIETMIKRRASDLHINASFPPQIRIDGTLIDISKEPLHAGETQDICYQCLNQEHVMRLEAEREIDLAFDFEGLTRVRCNIFWSMGCVAGAFRAISYNIPNYKELGIPESVMQLAEKPRGLILITGPTGCGKSTTLAAMIERINQTRREHIITIEDPIEYVYQQKKCVINQREVGSDSLSFPRALKYILRQDPNVVLVGEMRDLETIQSAITVAETGHLVLATLHTNSSVQSIDRMIDVFPMHQQDQIRTQLSFILEGVVSQQLLPRLMGGRALAVEILFPTSGIRNLIREAKTHQIFAEMQTGQTGTKMVTMDQSLASLVKQGIIDRDEAIRRCVDPAEFKNLLIA